MAPGPRPSWRALPRYLADDNRAYRAFLLAGVALALTGGLGLAIALPVDAATGHGLGHRWTALAQVHGHLQAIGFVGMIVMGLGLRLAPRFAGRRPALPWLTPVAFAAVLTGVLLRAVGQPLADHDAAAALLVIGAWLEPLGAAAFLAAVWSAALPAARAGHRFAPFFLAGSAWFVLSSLLGAVWLTALARDGRTALTPDRDQALLLLQLFGFHLMFVLGVASRAFATFFGRAAPPAWATAAALVLTQAGLATLLVTDLRWVSTASRSAEAEAAGVILLAAGLTIGILSTRCWTAPSRLRPAVQPIGRLLQLGAAWLLVACATYVFVAARALAHGRGLYLSEHDAVRHLVTVGVLMILIIAMTHIVLPEFSVERLSGRGARRRALGFGALLSLAAITRATPGLVNALTSTQDSWHMASAGVFALAALLWFAFLLLRAIRQQPLLLMQVAGRVDTIIAANARPPTTALPRMDPPPEPPVLPAG